MGWSPWTRWTPWVPRAPWVYWAARIGAAMLAALLFAFLLALAVPARANPIESDGPLRTDRLALRAQAPAPEGVLDSADSVVTPPALLEQLGLGLQPTSGELPPVDSSRLDGVDSLIARFDRQGDLHVQMELLDLCLGTCRPEVDARPVE